MFFPGSFPMYTKSISYLEFKNPPKQIKHQTKFIARTDT